MDSSTIIIISTAISSFIAGFWVGVYVGTKKSEERIMTRTCPVKKEYGNCIYGKYGFEQIGFVKKGKRTIDIDCDYLQINKICSINNKKCIFKI